MFLKAKENKPSSGNVDVSPKTVSHNSLLSVILAYIGQTFPNLLVFVLPTSER